MAVLNPSFEDAGLLPGEAEHWTLRTLTSRELIAGFGPPPSGGPELAWEDFESWIPLWRTLEAVSVVLAFFDAAPEGLEDFEETWENDLYLLEMPPAQLAAAALGPSDVEDCETGWDNEPYLTSWAEVAGQVGVFDGELGEDFEDHWSGNQAFGWTWGAVPSVPALFDAGAQGREDFENDWAAATTL